MFGLLDFRLDRPHLPPFPGGAGSRQLLYMPQFSTTIAEDEFVRLM